MSKTNKDTSVRNRKEKLKDGGNKLKASDEVAGENQADNDDKPKTPKYGPLPTIPYHRIWTRGVMFLGVLAIIYFNSKDKQLVTFARRKDVLERRAQDVPCSDDYKTELQKFAGCVPSRCGRLVTDILVSANEAEQMLRLAERGLAIGQMGGSAAILDLHSGALSHGTKFVNIYKLEVAKDLFKASDFELYSGIKNKIRDSVAHHFGIDKDVLHLTHPTFFSRLTGNPPLSLHDQYWHPHVDKETYKSFHYTSLLYLNDYENDFKGGRFVFVDSDNTNRTVEPKKGRVSMFTSGSENVHFVEQVQSGVRYAITVSFTCDKKHAIADPTLVPPAVTS